MDDWYRYYRAEINRRGDEIKAAEKHRLMELARNVSHEPPAQKVYQRIFNALKTSLFQRRAPESGQISAPKKAYGHE